MNKKEINEAFANHIEKERVELGYTQAEMARALDMSLSSYKNMISGATTSISIYQAVLAHRLTGKFLSEMIGAVLPESYVIEKWRTMNDHQREFLKMLADFECELKSNDEAHGTLPVLVPLGNCEDGMLWNGFTTDYIPDKGYRRKYPRAVCGIRITSNHLRPAFIKNDIILIDKRPPRDGDLAVIVNKQNGRAYLRKYIAGNPVRLEPINDYGETFLVDPEDPDELNNWAKFGCVITKIR